LPETAVRAGSVPELMLGPWDRPRSPAGIFGNSIVAQNNEIGKSLSKTTVYAKPFRLRQSSCLTASTSASEGSGSGESKRQKKPPTTFFVKKESTLRQQRPATPFRIAKGPMDATRHPWGLW